MTQEQWIFDNKKRSWYEYRISITKTVALLFQLSSHFYSQHSERPLTWPCVCAVACFLFVTSTLCISAHKFPERLFNDPSKTKTWLSGLYPGAQWSIKWPVVPRNRAANVTEDWTLVCLQLNGQGTVISCSAGSHGWLDQLTALF